MKLLFLPLILSLIGNDPSENGIPYRALTWADFRGPIPKEGDIGSWAAETATEIDIETKQVDGKLRYAVYFYFVANSSWVRVKTDAGLRHEQTHFKIAYIAFLRCVRDLEPFQNGDPAVGKQVENIYDRYVDEKILLNRRFDQETNHGLNKEIESLWELKISEQLKTIAK